MGRFLAGAASALLLAAGGLFLWTGLARHDSRLPAPPVAGLFAASAQDVTSADPPQASEKTREEKRFDRYDRNKDGKVDRGEYLLNRQRAFARLDTNHDGKLSFDEYAVKTEAKFAKADADKSGVLDPTEFATTRVVRKAKPRCPPAKEDSASEES